MLNMLDKSELEFLLLLAGLVLLEEVLQAETVIQSSSIVSMQVMMMLVIRQEWRINVHCWKVLSALARLIQFLVGVRAERKPDAKEALRGYP